MGRELQYQPAGNKPEIIFFVSSFCSKCMHNRQILHRFISRELIREIDIASSTEILQEVQPRMVPAISLIDSNGKIIFYEEGVIHDKTAEAIQLLMSRYLE